MNAPRSWAATLMVAVLLGLTGCTIASSGSKKEPPEIRKERAQLRTLRQLDLDGMPSAETSVSLSNLIIFLDQDLRDELGGRASIDPAFPRPPTGVHLDRPEWISSWLAWHVEVLDYCEGGVLRKQALSPDAGEQIATLRRAHEETWTRLPKAGVFCAYDSATRESIARILETRRRQASEAAGGALEPFLRDSVRWWEGRAK